MSGTRVAKLEALLARIQSRRTESGVQSVDALAGPAVSAAAVRQTSTLDKNTTRRTLPPSLLTLDEPPHHPSVSPAPVSHAPAATSEVDLDFGTEDLDTNPPPPFVAEVPAPAALDMNDDAFVTAVARPVPAPLLDPPTAVAEATRPVVMHVPTPVASGPIVNFVGNPKSHTLSFGQLVGLAMSLTTR